MNDRLSLDSQEKQTSFKDHELFKNLNERVNKVSSWNFLISSSSSVYLFFYSLHSNLFSWTRHPLSSRMKCFQDMFPILLSRRQRHKHERGVHLPKSSFFLQPLCLLICLKLIIHLLHLHLRRILEKTSAKSLYFEDSRQRSQLFLRQKVLPPVCSQVIVVCFSLREIFDEWNETLCPWRSRERHAPKITIKTLIFSWRMKLIYSLDDEDWREQTVDLSSRKWQWESRENCMTELLRVSQNRTKARWQNNHTNRIHMENCRSCLLPIVWSISHFRSIPLMNQWRYRQNYIFVSQSHWVVVQDEEGKHVIKEGENEINGKEVNSVNDKITWFTRI